MTADTITPDLLDLTGQDVEQILQRHYGVQPLQLQQMQSELSAVYRVETSDGRLLAFKAVRHSAEELALCKWRVSAMVRVQARGVPTGCTVPALDGGAVTVADTPEGAVVAHLGEWLGGTPLEAVNATRSVLLAVGAAAAKVAEALHDCPLPPAPVTHPWELVRTLESLEASMTAVSDPAVLQLLTTARDRFQEQVMPRLAGLPQTVVHHDLHDANLLINEADETVSGVLDFGDMVWGPRIAELAIAAAYACRGAAHPAAGYLDVAEGWGRVRKLTADEVEVLPAATIGRLAVNLGLWSVRSASDRADYARARSVTTGRALSALLDADADDLRRELHERLTASR